MGLSRATLPRKNCNRLSGRTKQRPARTLQNVRAFLCGNWRVHDFLIIMSIERSHVATVLRTDSSSCFHCSLIAKYLFVGYTGAHVQAGGAHFKQPKDSPTEPWNS